MFFFFFKVIFNICQVGCPVQEWKLFCQKLGVTEIIDFQVHGHVYGALRRPFSLISIPEGSCTYLNKKKKSVKNKDRYVLVIYIDYNY